MTSSPISDRSALFRLVEWIDRAIEKNFGLYSAIFVAAVLSIGLYQDVLRKLWLDELYTLYNAKQANPAEIVKATIEGADGIPPLYTIMVHGLLRVVPNESLAVRLPATIGFCGMMLFLFPLCRKRLPALYAWLAVALAVSMVWWTLTEGRPYSLALFCCVVALFCWESASDMGPRRSWALAGLAASLAFVVAFHYYYVFLVVPLFLGGMLNWRKSGKLDFAMLACLAAPLPVLALHYPFIAASRRFQAHFWSPANWSRLHNLYLYGPTSLNYVLILLAVAILLPFFFFRVAGDDVPSRPTLKPAEWLAYGLSPVMPVAILILSMLTTHVFVSRYTLWTEFGTALIAAAAIYKFARNKKTAGTAILAVLMLTIPAQLALVLVRGSNYRHSQELVGKLMALPQDGEPIVVADEYFFFELYHYSSPLRARLLFPMAPELDAKTEFGDTGALLWQALGPRTGLPAIPLETILAQHRRFILAPGNTHLYLPKYLTGLGYRVTALDPMFYRVELPQPLP